MLGKRYKDYESALVLVDLENLSERREQQVGLSRATLDPK